MPVQSLETPLNRPVDVGDYPLPAWPAWLALGWYAYALVDPRPDLPAGTCPLFYLGKGVGYRVMQHSWAALVAADASAAACVAAAQAASATVAAPADLAKAAEQAELRLAEHDAEEGSVGQDGPGLNGAGLDGEESEKLARIQAIHAAGYRVRMFVLDRQGFLDAPRGAERQAYVGERIAIDTAKLAMTGWNGASLADAGLTNLVHGQGHAEGDGATELFALLGKLTPEDAPPLPRGASLVKRGAAGQRESKADIALAVSGYWDINEHWRSRELAIFIVCDEVIKAVVRPRPDAWNSTRTAKGKTVWGWRDWDHLTELEAIYEGKRLVASMVGYRSWPEHPWVPQLDRMLHKLAAGELQLGAPPITLEQVWAGRGLDPDNPTPGLSTSPTPTR